MTWSGGPLPDQRLEDIACEMFALQFPMSAWGDPVFQLERNTYRRLALRLQAKYAAIQEKP